LVSVIHTQGAFTISSRQTLRWRYVVRQVSGGLTRWTARAEDSENSL